MAAFVFSGEIPLSSRGKRDVLLHGELRQHVERLEHEAEVVAPQQRERVVVQRSQLLPAENHRPGVRRLEAGDDIEQRRLADPESPRMAMYSPAATSSETDSGPRGCRSAS